MKLLSSIVSAFALCALTGVAKADPVAVDEKVKTYEQVAGVTGNLNSIGSDTLNNVMTLWAEEFQKLYPNVKVGIEGKGSATAPPALIAGTSQLGPMSREMKAEEVDQFEKKFGYKPTKVRVAIDALAVFVHKDNPVKGLSLTQVDGIFSSTFKRGGKDITKWGDLELTGDYAVVPVSLYGRNSASGTYGYFKEHALSKGDYKTTVKEQPGSSAVVQGVAAEKGAIGYSGIGYVTASVKALPLANKPDQAYVDPTYENCLSGKYPLARFLYVYVNHKPGEAFDKLTLEFLKFALSKQGQQVVVKDGYFPLTATIVEEDLAAISK